MALLVGKTTGTAIETTSMCLRTIKTLPLAQNRSCINSLRCLSYFDSITRKDHSQTNNFYGICRSFSSTPSYLDEAKMYFTKKHEWVSVVGNMGTIGITDYAQQALGKENWRGYNG